MFAVSNISTMNVLRSLNRSSLAPTLEKTLSTMLSFANFAGTKLPVCARIVINATCRKYVDLPAMLGPVIMCNRDESFMEREFEVKLRPDAKRLTSTVGWRPSVISMVFLSKESPSSKDGLKG